jgi:hypothetical protein
MTRMMSTRGAGDSHQDGAGSSETSEQGNRRLSLGRRALLTRGSVVAAGVVGAGVAATAMAGPASAQATTAVDMNTANDAGTNPAQPTELDADNDTAPAFILTNTGLDTSNTGAGPNLRLTPSAVAGGALEPTASTAGGDLTATADGELWFTHDFALESPPVLFPAPMHTEATANVYAQLGTPTRILDTRTSAGRKNIVNASGNLDSSGRLLAGKTIYINMDSLVFFAEVLLANLTIVDPTTGGYLTLWSGVGAVPGVSQINFAKSNPAIANFVSVNVAEHSSTVANAIAIHAAGTTQVILDVFAFIMPGFEYARYSLTAASTNAKQAARLERARQAVNAARRS